MTAETILNIENLCYRYPHRKESTCALQNIHLSLSSGKTLGIVGESGSGKTTLAKAIIRLIQPTEGNIFFQNQDIFSLSPKELKLYRRQTQFLFQNSDAALNPRMTIRQILSEPLEIHSHLKVEEHEKHLKQMLLFVHLDSNALEKYPHQFSGGQRQRINIARALTLSPSLLICDEPFSALDTTTQVHMVDLFRSLQKNLNLSMILIGHDLPLVAQLSDHIAVMHFGQIVEYGTSLQVCQNPGHPYTQTLFSSIPRL